MEAYNFYCFFELQQKRHKFTLTVTPLVHLLVRSTSTSIHKNATEHHGATKRMTIGAFMELTTNDPVGKLIVNS